MRARILAVAGVLAIALLLISGAGAGAVSTGLVGVDPATAVKQVGLLNYAGPNCPGIGWNCTTATNVIQVASAGGQNRFECDPEALGTVEATNTCVIDQSGDNNKARCKLRDTEEQTSVQTCTVTQTGKRNSADIDMTIEQKTGPIQDGQQTATVKQTATERNQSQIHQTVKQRASTGAEQIQDGYQLADVMQDATGSDNFSHVHQALDQDESGSATMQKQNIKAQPPCSGKDANQCARVIQNVFAADGGKNESHLHQAIGERQKTSATGTQLQGQTVNGQEGDVHQTNPAEVGENHDSAHEDLVQRQTSPTGTTSQHQRTDPRCCGGSQVGGEKNREDIHQSTTQSADELTADQNAGLSGEAHQVAPDVDSPTPLSSTSPDNKCRIEHHGRVNGGSGHFFASGEGPECIDLFLDTTCMSEGGEGDCFPAGDFSFSLPTAPTFGRDVAMPNYTSEPSDYTDPGGWW